MSRQDLLADLQGEVAARPAAPPTPPPAVPPPPAEPRTPALELSVTPLRWSMPSVGPVPRGMGLAWRLGPVKVSVALR